MIFEKELECMDKETMKALQLKRLQDTVECVYHKVPFYKKRLDGIGMTPDKFKTLDDLKEIPYTTKEDLRENYPFDMFAVPMKEVVRIHGSSGTTGKPTVVGYTKKDIDTWATLIARIAAMTGVTDDDIAQIAFGYGLFTGGFGLHYGLEKLGATVVPLSSGNTEKQLMLMKDFGTTVLVCTPSYAMHIAEVSKELGYKREDFKLRIGLFGGEGSTNEMREEIEKRLGILATENYGMSELIGPGVSGECYCKCGMHINEDHFIPEIINSDSGAVINPSDRGELVFTTLTKEAYPLLRYRTKDISYLIDEPCACGRTLIRMAKIQGRSDDMLIIKGVNVFPSQIEGVLLTITQISPHYQIIVTKNGYTDALEVQVELIDGSMLERYRELEDLTKAIRHKLHTVLGIDVKVKLVEPKTIERFVGKAKRVIDNRKIGENINE